MTKNFLEGFVKPEVNIETDVSKETNAIQNTYNQPVYINIGTLVITDKELGDKIVEAISRQQSPVEKIEDPHDSI
jgi:hypothetical protein